MAQGRFAKRVDGRRRPGRRAGRWLHTFAALDLGTNNCRLLVARAREDDFRVIDAFSRIVRLGEGVSASGRLSEAAMARAIDGLRVCAGKMRRRGVTRARSIATEACRRAANAGEFLDRARAETGLVLEVISPAEEARLAVDGCGPLLDYGYRRALVFDIGGGSIELMWLALNGGREPELVGWTSLSCGVGTLTERQAGGEFSPGDYGAMVAEVGAMLAGFDDDYGIGRAVAAGEVQLLGTSGTVTTLAGVHLGLAAYDRSQVDGAWIGTADAVAVARRLAAMDWAECSAVGCVGSDRADLVVAGCAVLEAIVGRWPVDRLRVADRGVREGLLRALMREADLEAETDPGAPLRSAMPGD